MTDHIGDANKMITPVEWLEDKLSQILDWDLIKLFEQAKEMEKSAIEKAVTFGNRQDCYDATETLGERYYNETYNK
jgi:hypothetical protein